VAKVELFDYIEVFYNQQRRHSTIAYLSPAAFERQNRNVVTALDGALVGTHTPTPTFFAQADERLHDLLPPLKKEIDGTTNMTDAN
jgi:hypothetical protein